MVLELCGLVINEQINVVPNYELRESVIVYHGKRATSNSLGANSGQINYYSVTTEEN